MLQNGDRVECKKTESGEWIPSGRFVGRTESGEFLCENKGQFSRFPFCRSTERRTVEPMDIDDICQLLDWGCFFKHEPSGTVTKNPTISLLKTDSRVIIDGRFVTEMLWALPEDATVDKWSRCEVEK